MSQSSSFKVGDIVQLKSGGPEMTIQRTPEKEKGINSYYTCQWFAGKKLESGNFPADSLKPVTPESK